MVRSTGETENRIHSRQAGSRRSPFVVWGLAGTTLAVIIGLGLFVLLGRGFSGSASKDLLAPLWEVPAFDLVERSGQPVTKADLLGTIWIADFIFTQCVDACPLLSQRMSKLQSTFASEADVRLVSITLDPVHDTPAVLTKYASRFNAHPQRWLFLTGDKKAIYDLSRDGFRLGAYDPNEPQQTSDRRRFDAWPASLNGMIALTRQWLAPASALAHHGEQGADGINRQAIQHSGRIVLIDRRGRIRQYYDSKDEDVLQRLTYHVTLLLREP